MNNVINIQGRFIEHINRIIITFDFNKVQIVMKALNWGYILDGKSTDIPPSIEQLKEIAIKNLKLAVREKKTVFSGGFESSYLEGYLSLKFVIEDSLSSE